MHQVWKGGPTPYSSHSVTSSPGPSSVVQRWPRIAYTRTTRLADPILDKRQDASGVPFTVLLEHAAKPNTDTLLNIDIDIR